MAAHTNTEVIAVGTPQGLTMFSKGGSIEFLTLEQAPSLDEHKAAPAWYPLPGATIGCLVWFNTRTGKKGRVVFPLKLTEPGEYAVGINFYREEVVISSGSEPGFRYRFLAAYSDGED